MKDNIDQLKSALAFKQAAVADGWSIKPTYSNHESTDTAATLNHPDGFTMQIYTRDHLPLVPNAITRYEVDISIWGTDTLSIEVPPVYNMQAIRDGMKKCFNCHKIVDQTFRYSFAGRCCKDCLPRMREIHEKSGWCD